MADKEDAMRFNAPDPIEIPVTIGTREYILRDLSEEGQKTYTDAMLEGMEFLDGHLSKLKNLGEMQSLLLSLCLFERIKESGEGMPDEVLIPVPLQVIRNWPARIVRPLSDRAKRISGLNIGGGKDGKDKGDMDGNC